MLADEKDIDFSGLDIPASDRTRLLSVDKEAWLKELDSFAEFSARFGERMPQAIKDQAQEMRSAL